MTDGQKFQSSAGDTRLGARYWFADFSYSSTHQFLQLERGENTTCTPDLSTTMSQGPEISLDCPQTWSWSFISVYVKNNWQVIVWGPNQGKKLSLHIPNPGPGEAADLPMKQVCLHFGPSVLFRRESPTTVTCLFVLVGSILMQVMFVSHPSQMYRIPQCCSDRPAKLHTYCAGAPEKVGSS